MLVINVVEDKIPANVYPELVEWVRDLNSIREEPIKLTMFVEDDIVRESWHGNLAIWSIWLCPKNRAGAVSADLCLSIFSRTPIVNTSAVVFTRPTFPR